MTPYAYEAFGADMAYPDPSIYEATFVLCDEIPVDREAERQSCLAGKAKNLLEL
ncbi:MAG: hypothetical protein R3B69_04355 [Candidatus Paceibacterota bacterium]